MDRKLYKAAYNRILDKKYLYYHIITFVIGNFILFFLSLNSWTPAFFYLLTLIWLRVIAIHIKNVFPDVVAQLHFPSEMEEDKAIEEEMKRLKKEKKKKKEKFVQTQELKLSVLPEKSKNYTESDLV